jgi:hypothetical protein
MVIYSHDRSSLSVCMSMAALSLRGFWLFGVMAAVRMLVKKGYGSKPLPPAAPVIEDMVPCIDCE